MDQAQPLVNLLELTYEELEELNLQAREVKDPIVAKEEYVSYLESQTGIKNVTVCFTDLEGKFHTIDYNKKFILKSLDNLTFDGSSIRGFSAQYDSDLKLVIDWTSITFLPSDIFGAGKVLVFANVFSRDLMPYESDFRNLLIEYAVKMKQESGTEAFMATELEGYLVEGLDAEKHYVSTNGFDFVAHGGYYHSLPTDSVREFIDRVTLALEAMGFRNEKAHPEVGPSQFEIDYSYTDVVRACDQVQLYKLLCRQIACDMGMTCTFLPKPIVGVNGNGMHTNFSLAKNGKNSFYDKNGKDHLSKDGWQFTYNLLDKASELCLIYNSSVNAYRRLDPHFEAPNEIKVTANDRGSLVRLPFGNEKTTRIEIRAVSPDTNPYLALYAFIRTGLENKVAVPRSTPVGPAKLLPSTINEAIDIFKASDYVGTIIGDNNKTKFLDLKKSVAERSSSVLIEGTVDEAEVLYHHEITNQYLWNQM
jgi:glutamine synthetase